MKLAYFSGKLTVGRLPINPAAVVYIILGYFLILIFFYVGWAPFLFGLVGCLLFFLLSIRYPDKAFLFLMAISIILPIDLAVKFSGLPRVGPTRIILALFLIGVFLRGFILNDYLLDPRKWPLKGPIFLFFLLAMTSSVFSINRNQSLYSLAGFGFEHFLLFFIAYRLLMKPGFFSSAKRCLYMMTALVCVLAIFEEVFNVNPLMFIYPDEALIFRGSILRVRSTFFHPIAFGCFLTLVFPFVFTDFLRPHTKNKRLPLLVLLLMMLTCLFLTVSRGPWVGLLLEMALLFWVWPKKEIFGKVIGISMALLVLIAGIWIYQNNYNVGNSLSAFINPHAIRLNSVDESSSEYYRLALAKSITSKMYGYRWLLGFGPGTFFLADVGSKYAGHEHTLTAADSHYLKLLFEQGILGLVAFVMLLGIVIKNGLRAICPTRFLFDHNAAAAACAIAGFTFENITVSMFLLLPLTILFWLYTALIMPRKAYLSSP